MGLTCLVLLDLNLMELTVVLKVLEMLGNQLCLIMASLFFQLGLVFIVLLVQLVFQGGDMLGLSGNLGFQAVNLCHG